MSKPLIYLVSLVVSAIPIVAGMRSARSGRRRVHALALAGIAMLSLAIGALTFAARASNVSALQALTGSAIAAAFGIAIPLAAYFELGYRIRSQLVLIVCWLVSAAPLFLYMAVVFFIVAGHIHCPPHASDCPV